MSSVERPEWHLVKSILPPKTPQKPNDSRTRRPYLSAIRARPPSEQQTHPAALVIDNGQVAGGIGAKHDRAEERTAGETIFPGTDLRLVLSLTGPS